MMTRIAFVFVALQTAGVSAFACLDLSGDYAMNADLFTLSQSGCGGLSWKWQDGSGKRSSFTFDGIEREIAKDPATGRTIFQKSTINEEKMVVSERIVLNGQETRRSRVFTLKTGTAPCGYSMPEHTYLIQEVYPEGDGQPSSCFPWAKTY
jgi:hypothetical protein